MSIFLEVRCGRKIANFLFKIQNSNFVENVRSTVAVAQPAFFCFSALKTEVIA